MIKPSIFALVSAVAITGHSSALAQSSSDGFALEAETYVGRDVIPPDVIESDLDQGRLEGVIGGAATARLRFDDTRVFARLGAEAFPVDNQLNRYSLSAGVNQEIPLARNGRIRARVGATYDHVLSDEGRVFNRVRGDAQLIARHSGGHSTVGRLRYGYRDQSEARFAGFDQNEVLGELRHSWRKPGSKTSLNVAVFALDVDAEDDRFSFQGIGARIIARTGIGEEIGAFARVSYTRRDYEEAFNQQFPVQREDDVFRVSAGLDRPLSKQLTGFAELGYIDHRSNVPTRDFQGTLGRVGLRIRLK